LTASFILDILQNNLVAMDSHYNPSVARHFL